MKIIWKMKSEQAKCVKIHCLAFDRISVSEEHQYDIVYIPVYELQKLS